MSACKASAIVSALLLFVAQPVRAQTPPAQPEMTSLKSTFIPGDKTIFFDDFTDMRAEDAPPHFKTRGPAPDLQAGGDLRQLTVTQRGTILTPNLTALPKNFTFETEFKADKVKRFLVHFTLFAGAKEVLLLTTQVVPGEAILIASLRAPYSELGRKRFPTNWSEPAKLAVWIQNGRMRVFLNG